MDGNTLPILNSSFPIGFGYARLLISIGAVKVKQNSYRPLIGRKSFLSIGIG